MLRNLLSLFFLLSFGITALNADVNSKKVEVIAKHLESTETTVNAKEGVIVYYDDAVIKAKTASYDKKTQILILEGDVEMMGYQGAKQKSQRITINTATDTVTFDELFFMNANDIWLYTKNARRNDHNYTFGNSMLSSCDVKDPIWKMYFNRSVYDSEAKYMKLYDTTVYFLDIPVFYSPYLAFTTQNERSSGLLFPLFGYNQDEGLIYEQPIFWNISPSMDLEFNPQIRTQRSIGAYATYRFVDSAYSSGSLRIGYFSDKKSYQLEKGNDDQAHYGLELNYDASKFFTRNNDTDMKDGLYINTILLNDIDYLNLQKSRLDHFGGLTPLQESKFNYFLHDDSLYAGMNAKYFIDTREGVEDAKTMQLLPSLQLHKYLDHLILQNLTYSVDMKLHNFERREGATFKQIETTIPLEWNFSLFEDYLNVAIGESLYYSKYFFGNETFENDAYEYYSNIHKVRFFSDLTKPYEGFIHVFQPSIEYSLPGNVMQNPVAFEKLSDIQKELFAIGLPEEHMTLNIGNYFYDDTMNLKFYDRIFQRYYIDRPYKFADLGNEMQYNWHKWEFYSNIVYAHEFDEIRESSNRISLNENGYNVSLGHIYKQKLPDDLTVFIPANDIIFDFSYDINARVKVRGGINYNLDDSENKQWNIGGTYARDCWSVDLGVWHRFIPRPSGVTMENNVYIQLSFIPFASIGSGK